jgi:type I restriction enzyme S subunit
MQKDVKEVPKLRFVEFNDSLRKVKFTDVSELIHGFQFRKEHFVEKGIPVVKIGNLVADGSINIDNPNFVLENSSFEKFLLSEGDILMALTGGTLGKVSRISKDYGKIYQNYRVGKFKPKHNSLKDFIYYLLQCSIVQNRILSLVNEAAQPNFGKQDFDKIKFSIPSKAEQQKIASFLSSVDTKLKLLHQKKDHLEQYKKGVMQQIFSQQLRFKPDQSAVEGDDNGNSFADWEEKRLENLTEKISSGKIKPQTNGKYFVYGSTGMIGKCDNYSHSGKFLLVARVGANAGRINYVEGKFGVTDNTLVIDVNNNLNLLFLKAFLINYNLNKLIFGSGQPLITGKQLKSLKIPLPSLKEQTKIATFLSNIDKKIALMDTQIENTQQFKKGLLQQMFV